MRGRVTLEFCFYHFLLNIVVSTADGKNLLWFHKAAVCMATILSNKAVFA